MAAQTRVPAIDGWFTMDEHEPHLLGSRCTTCGTVAFPPAEGFCRNPGCTGTDVETTKLSRRGRVWSYTDAQYQPPAPFIPPTDPYEPFAIAAVELAEEQLIVIGQLVPGVTVDDLAVGTEVELVLGPLFTDDAHEHVIWKWQPTERAQVRVQEEE